MVGKRLHGLPSPDRGYVYKCMATVDEVVRIGTIRIRGPS